MRLGKLLYFVDIFCKFVEFKIVVQVVLLLLLYIFIYKLFLSSFFIEVV